MRFLAIASLTAVLSSTSVPAYESYHDPSLDDAGYCSTCHPGFKAGPSDSLHALHTGGNLFRLQTR